MKYPITSHFKHHSQALQTSMTTKPLTCYFPTNKKQRLYSPGSAVYIEYTTSTCPCKHLSIMYLEALPEGRLWLFTSNSTDRRARRCSWENLTVILPRPRANLFALVIGRRGHSASYWDDVITVQPIT